MTVKKTTISISGFGGGYEDACQRMLWKGVRYLAEVQPPVSIWEGARQYAGVTGIMTTDGEGLKALETAVMDGEDDITGAMHQTVMNHLAYIHHNGVEGWLETARSHDPNRIREWEGDLAGPAASEAVS